MTKSQEFARLAYRALVNEEMTAMAKALGFASYDDILLGDVNRPAAQNYLLNRLISNREDAQMVQVIAALAEDFRR